MLGHILWTTTRSWPSSLTRHGKSQVRHGLVWTKDTTQTWQASALSDLNGYVSLLPRHLLRLGAVGTGLDASVRLPPTKYAQLLGRVNLFDVQWSKCFFCVWLEVVLRRVSSPSPSLTILWRGAFSKVPH